MSPPGYNREELTALCRHRGIRRLSLFGSVLKGTDRPDNDIDLLVEFEPDSTPACSVWRRSRRICAGLWADDE